jgi:hypothetical protein
MDQAGILKRLHSLADRVEQLPGLPRPARTGGQQPVSDLQRADALAHFVDAPPGPKTGMISTARSATGSATSRSAAACAAATLAAFSALLSNIYRRP